MKISYAAVPLLFFLFIAQRLDGMQQIELLEKKASAVELKRSIDNTVGDLLNKFMQKLDTNQSINKSAMNTSQLGSLLLLLANRYNKEDKVLSMISSEKQQEASDLLHPGRMDELSILIALNAQEEKCNSQQQRDTDILDKLNKIYGNQSHIWRNRIDTGINASNLLFGFLMKFVIIGLVIYQVAKGQCAATV